MVATRRSASKTRPSVDEDVTAPRTPTTRRRNNPVLDAEVQNVAPATMKPTSPALPNTVNKKLDIHGGPLGGDHDGSQSRCASFFKRLWAGLSLFGVFCGAVHLGHPVLVPLIIVVQYMMYRELVTLSYTHLLETHHAQHIPLFRTQSWFWFILAIFYSYSRVLHTYLGIDIPHHLAITFGLFCVGFVWFVLTLQKGLYRVQFGMLAWTWISLLIFVIVETTAVISMMFRGLFWLVLPVLLVITNDSWAYVWGLLFGRHSLLELSPKKTWEGFIGALISTPIQGFLMARYMMTHPILTCPQTVLSLTHPSCPADPLFELQPYALPFVIPILNWTHVLIAPAQFHVIYMSLFASFIAPFGGFFASGFKRAFAIKDFGTLIPGHGGFTDRMDCQLVMGLFVYIYYYSVIQPSSLGECAELLFNNASSIDADALYALYNKMQPLQKAAFNALINKE